MPSQEWVVDTCILEIAQDPADGRALDALALLHALRTNHRVAFDHGSQILNEYSRHAPHNSHAGQWLRVILQRSDRVMYRAGNVSERHRRHLIEELRFDRSDLIFVGTCAGGPDRLLVTEDSDYSDEIKEYLSVELGVTVLSITEAVSVALGA